MWYKRIILTGQREFFYKLKKSKEMNLEELLQTNANISLTVSLTDLRTYSNELIQRTKSELEAELIATRQESYLTRLETANFLKVDQATLWRWKQRSYLMPIEVGGKRMYRKSDLMRILNGGK